MANTPETDRNKDAVVRFMRLMDSHNFERLNEVLVPDLKLHLGAANLDRTQTEDMIRKFYLAFPDFTHTVEDVLAVDDRVVLRATDRGTHRGVFQGVAPTGRRVLYGQIAIYRMVSGRIAEIWEEADILGLMEQLRAAPAPA